MKVDEGWHVNANEPSQDYLIGTALNIDTLSGITVSGMQYPDSERFTFAFAGEPPDVYQGKAPIFVTLKTAPDLKPGSYTLRVQACDDKSCMAPSTLDIAIPVEVVAAETRFKSINQDLFSDYTGTYAEKILKRMPK
jgi:thiol:disulfide interchange protein DsbD